MNPVTEIESFRFPINAKITESELEQLRSHCAKLAAICNLGFEDDAFLVRAGEELRSLSLEAIRKGISFVGPEYDQMIIEWESKLSETSAPSFAEYDCTEEHYVKDESRDREAMYTAYAAPSLQSYMRLKRIRKNRFPGGSR